MISPDEIEFGKYGSTMKGGGKILYVGHWVPVRGGESVQGSIIPTWSPVTCCFLWHHVKR